MVVRTPVVVQKGKYNWSIKGVIPEISSRGCVIQMPTAKSKFWIVYVELLAHNSCKRHYLLWPSPNTYTNLTCKVMLFLMLLKGYLSTQGLPMSAFQRSLRLVLMDGEVLIEIPRCSKTYCTMHIGIAYFIGIFSKHVPVHKSNITA